MMLDELRDTTASIYFTPDIFLADLIQARMDTIGDMPVVAVCETPFYGVNGLIKRASDLVLAALILVLISPLLLAIAIGVKLSSPGRVLFKQRRYGLNGKEIRVLKFRTMTVLEDGPVVTQAKKGDQRITRFGAFMRSNIELSCRRLQRLRTQIRARRAAVSSNFSFGACTASL